MDNRSVLSGDQKFRLGKGAGGHAQALLSQRRTRPAGEHAWVTHGEPTGIGVPSPSPGLLPCKELHPSLTYACSPEGLLCSPCCSVTQFWQLLEMYSNFLSLGKQQ